MLAIVGLWGFGEWQDNRRQNSIQNCQERFGEDAAYGYDGKPCINASIYRDEIITTIKNNQPVTIQTIAQTTDLDRYDAEIVLEKLAKEKRIYSYDRGWSSDGWKILKNNSEAK